MAFEIIEHEGKRLAEILFSSAQTDSTVFFSENDAALQLGLMSHRKGFIENPHSHPEMARPNSFTQQFFTVLEGRIAVDFYHDSGKLIKIVELVQGDSILIIQGIHRIRTLERSRCVTIKQGPFIPDLDKVEEKF